MRCQACGHENPAGGIFCEQCGAIVAGRARPDDSRLAGPKSEIRQAIESRRHLDRIIPTWIVWINIILIGVSVIGVFVYIFSSVLSSISDPTASVESVFSAYGLVFLVGIATQLIFAAIAYLLIERHNNHANREKRLKNAVLSLARNAATTPESQAAISRELQALDYYVSTDQRHRVPAFWALLVMSPAIGSAVEFLLFSDVFENGFDLGTYIGGLAVAVLFALVGLIATFYVFYFLMKEESAHEDDFYRFAMDSRRLLTRLGYHPGSYFELKGGQNRSFALYVVLTLFTGIFVYYWWYVLIKDPNDHYRSQWKVEDDLLRTIGA